MDKRWPFFSVDVEITNICERDCAFCPREAISRPKGIMSENIFEEIASKLIKIPSRIVFSGMGNPLINEKWFEFIHRYKKNRGVIGISLHAGSLSNGVSEQLTKIRPNFVEISFPSMDPRVFAKLCPNDSLKNCLEKVEIFHGNAKGKIGVTIKGLRTAINPGEEVVFKDFWRMKGLNSWIFPCHSRGGNLKKPELVFCNPLETNASCGIFSFHSFITWEGKVQACCHDLTGETTIGNLSVEPWEKISQRKLEIIEKGSGFKLCDVCDELGKNFRPPDSPFPKSNSEAQKFLRGFKGQGEAGKN